MSTHRKTTSETPDGAQPEPNGRRRRGIFLLPNLFTTATLFAGFFAIVSGIDGQFQSAAIAIYVAMVMDTLDGRVARLTHTQTDFGKEYDSLADMVSFGLAPALLVYVWAFADLGAFGWYWFELGWLVAFVYAAGAALRLARFNTQAGSPEDKRFFRGLPSPSAAALVAGTVWVCADMGIEGASVAVPVLLITLICGALMVSNISYYSFKDLKLTERVPFAYILGLVLVFALIAVDPPRMLYILFLAYVSSGPLLALYRRYRQRARRRAGTDEE